MVVHILLLPQHRNRSRPAGSDQQSPRALCTLFFIETTLLHYGKPCQDLFWKRQSAIADFSWP